MVACRAEEPGHGSRPGHLPELDAFEIDDHEAVGGEHENRTRFRLGQRLGRGRRDRHDRQASARRVGHESGRIPDPQEFSPDRAVLITEDQHLSDVVAGGEDQAVADVDPDPEIAIDGDRASGTSFHRDRFEAVCDVDQQFGPARIPVDPHRRSLIDHFENASRDRNGELETAVVSVAAESETRPGRVPGQVEGRERNLAPCLLGSVGGSRHEEGEAAGALGPGGPGPVRRPGWLCSYDVLAPCRQVSAVTPIGTHDKDGAVLPQDEETARKRLEAGRIADERRGTRGCRRAGSHQQQDYQQRGCQPTRQHHRRLWNLTDILVEPSRNRAKEG